MYLIFLVLSTIISLILSYVSYKYRYWERKGVPQLKPQFFFGSFFELDSIHKTKLIRKVYQQFKDGKTKIAGTYVYTKPAVVILDFEIIKSILIKDFNYFLDRFANRSENMTGPLDMQLFLCPGDKWRHLRIKLTPTFTSLKMKGMFPTVLEVAKQLDAAFRLHVSKTPNEDMELHEMMARYTTDIIGHCAFGVECNSLKDPNVEFRHMGRKVFYPQYFSIRWRIFQLTYPHLFKIFTFFNYRRFALDVEQFITHLVRETVRIREEQNIKRNDFLNLLMEMRHQKDENGQPLMTTENMAAQVFAFFIAGFETSSSNLSFGIYELAKNPHIQDKLRAEIMSVMAKHNGKLTYEAIQDMTYLDCVMTETIRMYPALAAITRITTEDYKIPGMDVVIEKDTHVWIPAKEIHYDPDVYENPTEFRPERFSPEEVQKRHPQAFLGFGDGPRNCIGLRFARMEVRVGLITLLTNYRFTTTEKTPKHVEISKYSSVLVPHSKLYVKVEKL
ncbi:cytochrome P450 6a8 [Eurosta solidaginis]|uniref:cytochrome P450 6a8 n=1 Tax=Eurosta solidaginis TaxID=178769 RepID=UPI003530875F